MTDENNPSGGSPPCPLCGSTAVWHRCLGAELPAGGDTADRRIDLASEVADIREELVELQTRFERVMQDVRRLPGGDWLYQRVDAYPGIRLDRDMGAGQDADGWLAEAAVFLEGEDSAARATTTSGMIARSQYFVGRRRQAGCHELPSGHDDALVDRVEAGPSLCAFHATYHASTSSSSDSGRVLEPPWGHSNCVSRRRTCTETPQHSSRDRSSRQRVRAGRGDDPLGNPIFHVVEPIAEPASIELDRRPQ